MYVKGTSIEDAADDFRTKSHVGIGFCEEARVCVLRLDPRVSVGAHIIT